MKNISFYVILLLNLIILQTVIIPEALEVFNQFFSTKIFEVFFLDFFLLLVIYFAFNRDFFHGAVWLMLLFFIESSFGIFYSGAQIPSVVLIFLLVQFLKIQFVFMDSRSIQIAVFGLIMIKKFAHLYFGITHLSLFEAVTSYFFVVLASSFFHALVAPHFFWFLNQKDSKTLYQFDKQKTLFTNSLRSI